MAKERCRTCGKKVRVQIQKNTGYCSTKCQEIGHSVDYDALEDRLSELVASGMTRSEALAELGFCPDDLESMPCTTCGAGL